MCSDNKLFRVKTEKICAICMIEKNGSFCHLLRLKNVLKYSRIEMRNTELNSNYIVVAEQSDPSLIVSNKTLY